MILDSIANSKRYETISPAFAAAMRFLSEHRDGGLTEGKHPISDDAYAMVKRYTTKAPADCKFEAHRDYIDVQYVVSGDERMGWAPLSKMTVDSYDAAKDFAAVSGEGELYPLHAGEFMILFPDDAHMPNVSAATPCVVEKIILKIRVGR